MSKELPEVENVIAGPGSLLAEARASQGLSVEDVAARLNFRVSLVKNIEADIYDKNLPDTFNRGYLKNYAKLVNIPNADVIGLYESMNGIGISPAKMQSFSNGTMKKAQNSMLMWITYLILAIFIGFTVMWWLQGDKANKENAVAVATENLSSSEVTQSGSNEQVDSTENVLDKNINELEDNPAGTDTPAQQTQALANTVTESLTESDLVENNLTSQTENASEANTLDQAELTQVVFTFSGDCWVNIYDALGERIAWGIKKTGYVMTIDAQSPLKITIGKPELVEINFGREAIDMSVFPKGHIAKFTLPLTTQSS
ncbi:RodZ domain-containing protein [Pseudocolwellia sp. HL-MZ19]|uniref:RodZ domain-containing protein n=1 Tax=unclassified Pseudocolwellia TaxID=2848178 RepID=UPI003CF17EA5